MRKNTDKKADAAKLAGDATMEQEVARHRQVTQLATALEDFRVRKGLRQKDIAARMGVSESTVSRIEDSLDADLRVGDVAGYAHALGMDLTLFLEDPKLPASERIKYYVIRAADALMHLTKLAKQCHDDNVIVTEIIRFRSEVLLNFLTHYAASEYPAPFVVSAYGQHLAKRQNSATVKQSSKTSSRPQACPAVP